jgi:uncharacterized protein (TIGR00255 family)
MTGFGSARSDTAELSARAEVRTTNHRFLSLKSRLPPHLVSFEPQIELLVREHMDRGVVHVFLQMDEKRDAAAVRLSTAVARRYVAMLRRMAKDLAIAPDIDLRLLATLPGVVEDGAAKAQNPEADFERVRPLLRKAVLAAVSSREREGEHLRKDLLARSRGVSRIVDRVRRRAPSVVADYRDRLSRRLTELLAGRGTSLSETDLVKEVALFADRSDVTEEITRLEAHIVEAERLLGEGEGLGRRLDFLLQEMHREVNTIGSKASDAKMAHDVVALKSELEKMREQIQNLE